MPTLTVREHLLAYQSSTSATRGMTPIVFIHGAGGSIHVWTNQLRAKIPGCYQLALDLPGHARSQGQGEEEVPAYAQWITEFLQTLGDGPCILAGHSMGGAIAQTVALNHPKLLKAIILIGTGARLRVAQDILDRARKGASFAHYAYAPNTPVALQREAEKEFKLTGPEVRYRDFLACDRFDIMDRVQTLHTPALIVCGAGDKLTPVKYSQFLHEQLPDSRLEIIPEAGHMVMWEQAEAVNQVIGDFVSTLES